MSAGENSAIFRSEWVGGWVGGEGEEEEEEEEEAAAAR